MIPEKRVKLEKNLAGHGLTVLLTRDYDAILLHLARLAQFERLMEELSGNVRHTVDAVEFVRAMQKEDGETPPRHRLEIIDIPSIMRDVHDGLHTVLDRKGCICPNRLHAAVAVFVGILCAEVKL